MFPFSSREAIYQDNSTFSVHAVLRRRVKHKFCAQVILKRRIKQRLATIVIFNGVVEGQNSSREEAREKPIRTLNTANETVGHNPSSVLISFFEHVMSIAIPNFLL